MTPYQKIAIATEALSPFKVVGISAEDHDDRSTWRLDFADDATKKIKKDAADALDTLVLEEE